MQLSHPEQLTLFLSRLGQRYSAPARLYLFGGSALLWMGGNRNTADIDFTLSAPQADALRLVISAVASELDLDVEESAPAEFMPLPSGADARHHPIGRYGNLEAFLFDPYSIAVMKIDRAFETDMEDVRFLVQAGHVDLAFLAQCVEEVAARYDEPLKLRHNFEEFKRSLEQ